MLAEEAKTEYHKILKKNFTTIRITSLQIVFAIGIFGYIAFCASQKEGNVNYTSVESIQQLKQTFFSVCIIIFASLKYIKNVILKQKMNKLVKSRNIGDAQFFINKIFMSAIIGLGAAQAPALFGMVITIQSKNMNDFYMFSILSVIMFISNIPKYKHWEELLNSKLNALAISN